MMRKLAVLTLASVALASCGSEAEAPRDSDGAQKAEGEVLGGSVSDEMIPLDQLRSQSPALERVETVTTTETTDGSDAGGGSTTTTVETTVSVTTGEPGPPPPEPPQPPQITEAQANEE